MQWKMSLTSLLVACIRKYSVMTCTLCLLSMAVKSFAFVNLVTDEERVNMAVNELSEIFQFSNKLFVEFRKGSKYEYLKVGEYR